MQHEIAIAFSIQNYSLSYVYFFLPFSGNCWRTCTYTSTVIYRIAHLHIYFSIFPVMEPLRQSIVCFMILTFLANLEKKSRLLHTIGIYFLLASRRPNIKNWYSYFWCLGVKFLGANVVVPWEIVCRKICRVNYNEMEAINTCRHFECWMLSNVQIFLWQISCCGDVYIHCVHKVRITLNIKQRKIF